MDTERAISLLREQIEISKKSFGAERGGPEWKKWKRDTEIVIQRIFGEAGRHEKDFTKIRYSLMAFTSDTPDYRFQEAYEEGMETARQILTLKWTPLVGQEEREIKI